MIDKNGTKLSRGTRVLVEYPDKNLSWTGRVIGKGMLGRVKVKSEYVTWKYPTHVSPAAHVSPANLTRLDDQRGPIRYTDEHTTIVRLYEGR